MALATPPIILLLGFYPSLGLLRRLRKCPEKMSGVSRACRANTATGGIRRYPGYAKVRWAVPSGCGCVSIGRANNASGVIRRYPGETADNRKRLFALRLAPPCDGLACTRPCLPSRWWGGESAPVHEGPWRRASGATMQRGYPSRAAARAGCRGESFGSFWTLAKGTRLGRRNKQSRQTRQGAGPPSLKTAQALSDGIAVVHCGVNRRRALRCPIPAERCRCSRPGCS